jgi:hypothetical protein
MIDEQPMHCFRILNDGCPLRIMVMCTYVEYGNDRDFGHAGIAVEV